jgi:hypothetical protein
VSVKQITGATVLKASPGTLLGINVIVEGTSGAGAIYDSASTEGNSVANQVGTIPSTAPVGPLLFNRIPCNEAGITVVPATGQTLAAWYI